MTEQIGKYPNTFYRVSLKAVIQDDKGRVLVVKEHDTLWDFPGGGIDHGESASSCLLRELKEEVSYEGSILESHMIGLNTRYLPTRDAVLMCIFYSLKLENYNFSLGDDANDVKLIDPIVLRDSSSELERKLYEVINWQA